MDGEYYLDHPISKHIQLTSGWWWLFWPEADDHQTKELLSSSSLFWSVMVSSTEDKRKNGSSGKQVNIYFQKISFGFGQLTWEDNYWYFYSWWRELISKGMRFLINSTKELLAALVLGDDDDGLSRKYLRIRVERFELIRYFQLEVSQSD